LAVVADAGLRPGDCLIDVAGCRIDARLDATLDRMRAVLDPDSQVAADPEADYS
jgi:flagellar biosynthesis/type III secretory pathway protein FliH